MSSATLADTSVDTRKGVPTWNHGTCRESAFHEVLYEEACLVDGERTAGMRVSKNLLTAASEQPVSCLDSGLWALGTENRHALGHGCSNIAAAQETHPA